MTADREYRFVQVDVFTERACFVHISLHARDGQASHIRVGGGVVPVIEGTLRVPAAA